jgi:methionine sulfoxide reductase heme-binding subunit
MHACHAALGQPSAMSIRTLKLLLFVAALLPLAWLGWGVWAGALGANPIETITRETGTWTLRFLVLTLAVTPLRRMTGWNGAIRFRRMLGLFAFFYGSVHLLTYLWLDQFFDWASILKDVAKRPFITAGAAGFLMMLPLAVTSTSGMIRRLGGRAWRALHRLAYLAAAAGVVHYWWLVKADIRRPRAYAIVVAVLLGYRAVLALREKAIPGFGEQRT